MNENRVAGFYGPRCRLHNIVIFESNKRFSWQQVLGRKWYKYKYQAQQA